MAQEDDLLESLLEIATEELDKLDNNKAPKKISESITCSPNRTTETNLEHKTLKARLKDTDIFQFESCTKLTRKSVSIVHSGDTDSSDDEGNRNYEDQKYNEYGREIKSCLNSSQTSALEKNFISSSHYGVSKKRISTWKTNPNASTSSSPAQIITVSPVKNTKPMYGGLPETEKKFQDVYMDPIFGMRIVNPLISSSLLIERMQGRLAVRYSDLSRHIFGENLKDRDWVICGVVVSKSPPKTSNKGSQYSIWTLSDLKDDIKTFSLFMFSSAHKDLWKTAAGAVVAVLNPSIMDQRDGGKKEISLSVNNAQKIMIFGQSKDFGTCKSMKKNGEKCTAVVNLSRCEFCIYHIKQEYQKCSKRSELQANFAGQGLINLRNKVLGKNEVFYAGRSYMAIPAKKSQKLEARDRNLLQNLSGMKKSGTEKNVPKKRKGVARHLDVNPAQRARDLQLLEKLGGSSNLETKTTFLGKRSDEVTLEESKATALSIINKLKTKKSDAEELVNNNSRYDLKNDLFINVDSKNTFSGNFSEEVSIEESKTKAAAVISKLKANNTNCIGNKGNKVQSSDDENLATIEEIESQLNFEDFNLDEDDSKLISVPQMNHSNSLNIDNFEGSSVKESVIFELKTTKNDVIQKSEDNNCHTSSSVISNISFGKMSPKLSKTKVNPNHSVEPRKMLLNSPKTKLKVSINHNKHEVPLHLKSNSLNGTFLSSLKPLPNNSPKSLIKSNSKIKEHGKNAVEVLDLNDGSSTHILQCINSNESFLESSNNGLRSRQSDLNNMAMDIPMLSGSGSGNIIDLSKPVASKHVDRAKINAIKFIQRNGPIKKVDPNSTKSLGGKKRNIDKVTGLINDITGSETVQSAAKKSKLQESEFISDRFKKMMAMTSKYAGLLEQHDDEAKEKYFKKLEVKEKMEEKMTGTHKVKCKAVRCLQCKYTSFSASDLCKNERHPLKVCKKFNEVGGKLLSRGFIQLEKRHAAIYKRVKSALPRRESERKNHPLARHTDILQCVETRMNMLNMTYMRYIESRMICFVPGKVLDEIKSILDLVESNKTPPRTHQLLQELRDLSSMAMEHFDEHILPRCKEQLDPRTGSPEKILKELEVVAGSLTPYPFQDIIFKNVASTSKSARLLFNQQLPHALSAELYKVKKTTKHHRHHITYLTQNTQKLCLKVRRQASKLRIQTVQIHEQERKLQEQNSKILEQEAALNDIKKHIDEWDQKYKDLTAELVRARDEILLKAATTNSPILNSPLLSPPLLSPSDGQNHIFKTNTLATLPLKTNIKPRAAHILPKSYLSFDFDRKRKSSLSSEVPVKRNRNPSATITLERQECSQKMGEDIQNLSLNVPDLKNFESTIKDTHAALAKVVETTSRCMADLFQNESSANPLNCVKARKRKMTEDIDLK